ncbi:MAG: glycosyltransferase family 9 protein [Candidatus Omnitrophica bacterium]|nr:glycosyltransferase family 9 protein [Candidatus Omnitrophota bacterium]
MWLRVFLGNLMVKAKTTFSRKEISILCAQATDPDEVISKPAVGRLFSDVVESLCDSFLPRRVALYDRIFAQVIDYCRHLPDGQGMDDLLKRFGLSDERAILARKKNVEKMRKFSVANRKKVKKICVLSRVTIGADVAVTGVVLSKLVNIFPGVCIVVIGPKKLVEVFGGHPNISIKEVPYVRRGGLLGRLNSWVDLVCVIDEERRGLRPDEFLLIDPDSRLTQLGLLPVIPKDDGYYFFQSRTYAKARSGRIGELTANWLDQVFGPGSQKTYPEIFIDKNILKIGRACAQKLSHSGARPIVCINFGVGGNEKKRVSPDFEDNLVRDILNQGAAVILDKGFGDEVDMVNVLVSKLRAQGKIVLDANEGNIFKLAKESAWPCDVLTWEGGLAVFGALIASSNVYMGYDSGFQHIASAQGVPIVDIFFGAPSSLFIKRWTPYGKNRVKIVGGQSLKKDDVTPDHVLSALKKLLSEQP